MKTPVGMIPADLPYRCMVETSVDSIICTDPSGRVTFWNRASELLFGYSAQEALGRPLTFLAPAGGKADDLARLAAFRGGLAAAQFEVVRVTKSGRPVPVWIRSWPLRDARGKFAGVCSIVRDLTERKLAEQAVAQRRGNELEWDVVSSISHDFRTPLCAIGGFAEALRQGAIDDPKVRAEFLSSIERHVARLTGLVDDVLEFTLLSSKLKDPDRRPVELERLVDSFLRGLAPLFKRHRLKAAAKIPSGLLVSADQEHLERVLHNLVGNAIKFSRPGGRIDLEARRQGSGIVVVSVSDEGVGIDRNDLPLIFERFHRGGNAPERKGTGLGLAIVKGIVEAHGGRVWAESEKGKGTTIRFTLPSAEGTVAS